MTKQNMTIGKLKGKLSVKSKTSGKVNHVFDGFILDQNTGNQILVKIVIPEMGKKFDTKSRKFVESKDADLQGIVYMKGIRTQEAYDNKRFLDVTIPDKIISVGVDIVPAKQSETVTKISVEDSPF